jgi:hypothetical protein
MTIETTLRGAARTAYIAAHEKGIACHAAYEAAHAHFKHCETAYESAEDGSRGVAAKAVQEAFTALCAARAALDAVPAHHRPPYEPPRSTWLTLRPGCISNGPYSNNLDHNAWEAWLVSRGIPLPPKGTEITAEYLIEIGV